MRATKQRMLAIVLGLGLTGSILVGADAGAEEHGEEPDAECAEATHPGGAWPSYGQDLSNSRSQDQEDEISPSEAPLLSGAWAFSPQDRGGTGRMESTPVVAEGCVYVTTSTGYVYALNADTGELVWEGRYAETISGVCCGGTMFAPAVHDGVAYINVARNPETSSSGQGPYVLALDAHTGDVLWESDSVAEEDGAYTNSSAVYYDGMVWIGISQPEMESTWTGGFAILDAETGEILDRTRTIPKDQFEEGFSGGAIWSTAAVDDNGYGYATTGQPSPWTGKESELVNAIIKFDFARARDASGNKVDSSEVTNPDFGEIVGAIKGTWDRGLDVDFGASPTLYEDTNGQQMVAAYQKSGWLHAGYTRHMTHAWSRPLAPLGFFAGNYSSTATDGESIFGVGTYPGQMWSVDGSTGIYDWAAPVGTTFGANPVAHANGVIYHADGKGFLDAYDADTGAPLLHRPMSADAGAVCTNVGGGVAIARNTVYAICGERNVAHGFGPSDADTGWLIAYQVP